MGGYFEDIEGFRSSIEFYSIFRESNFSITRISLLKVPENQVLSDQRLSSDSGCSSKWFFI